MTAGVLAHHALLVLAVVALAAAAWRVASKLGGRVLERLLATFALACAAAACESLGLGLFDLGGSSAALGIAALATWAAARTALDRPPVSFGGEIARWLGSSAAAGVAAVAGLAGVAVAWIVWQLVYPLVGGDGLIYHLPIASAWVQNGRPGSVVNVLDGLSVANYPVTNEVLVSWGLALSRSWVVSSMWSVVLLAALAAAAWATLRTLAVPPRERILGIVAICVTPLVVAQLSGPDTDIAALTWLVVTAALALAARERPRLIYPAIVAAGLCLGTKTTPGILILGLVAIARRPLLAAVGDRRVWFLASVAAAVAVGGVWSVRDVIVHGSPFWPLEASPWGTPVQASLVPLEPSFLSDPRGLIDAHGSDYLRTMAGALVLIGGGLAVAGIRRSRAALSAGGLAGVALLAWAVSPYTGIESGDFAAGATRYLLPAIAACALALVVSTRGAGRLLRAGIDGLLVASIAYSAIRTARLGGQFVPGPATLALGVLAGLAAGWLARRIVLRSKLARPTGGSHRGAAAPALAGTVAVIAAIGLAAASDGFVQRHARTGEIDGPVLQAGLPGLGAGSGLVAEGPATVVMLRGDHFEHPLSVIPAAESCASVRARLADQTVVLQGEPVTPVFTRLTACMHGIPAEFTNEYVDVYG